MPTPWERDWGPLIPLVLSLPQTRQDQGLRILSLQRLKEGVSFAEYTTQQQDLLEKLRNDLDKCFDETKTGVPVDRIERVILCFNAKLKAADEPELLEICQARGVNLDLFGIGALAFNL
jgi:hypothetical protein